MKNNLQSIKQRFGIIGNSAALEQALGTAMRVAKTDLSVLIRGESGVGKEVFSNIIHQLSPRKHEGLIAINCGAIPEGTINSELFGHEKGAFTGAATERKGYFESYNGGTIFLDEIGEMPLDTQAFLLRILESGEFIRVGSSKVIKTDIRIVAATNVDLEDKIRDGKFREDLYYRLNTVPIRVPALKDRPEDIYMLFRKFTLDFASKYRSNPIQLDEKARLLIENYSWPGNIRELKNVAEQLSVLVEDRLITAEHLMTLVPNIIQRNLPALRNQKTSEDTLQEREILYKLLFEMRNDLSEVREDLNDVKSLILGLIQTNDLEVPDVQQLKQLKESKLPNTRPNYDYERSYSDYSVTQNRSTEPIHDYNDDLPIILSQQSERDNFESTEVVEESLSLADMEKDMIKKALKKHSGRRKDAAADLEISERTLYRKIKQYEL